MVEKDSLSIEVEFISAAQDSLIVPREDLLSGRVGLLAAALIKEASPPWSHCSFYEAGQKPQCSAGMEGWSVRREGPTERQDF